MTDSPGAVAPNNPGPEAPDPEVRAVQSLAQSRVEEEIR